MFPVAVPETLAVRSTSLRGAVPEEGEAERETERVALSNLAVTLLLLFIVMVQVEELPEQAPDQPTKIEPEAGVAVEVTVVP